jgi:Spy/CpxP family protein refolding chaperone
MKKLSIVTLVIFACAATVLVAQGPPTPPDPATRAEHQVKRLTTLLSLSTAQQQQATTIFTDAAKAEMALHQQLRSAHQNLGAAVKANNAATIDQVATTLGNLMAQSISTQAKAQAAFYQILSPEQQQKLSELQSEGPGFGGGFGFGGPGPGHFPR